MVSFNLMAHETHDSSVAVDHQFLNHLRVVGVCDPCQALNINFDTVFAPLANHVNHPYKRYCYSVTYDTNGKLSNPSAVSLRL